MAIVPLATCAAGRRCSQFHERTSSTATRRHLHPYPKDEGYCSGRQREQRRGQDAPLLDEADVRAHHKLNEMVIEDFADYEAAFTAGRAPSPTSWPGPRNVISMLAKMSAGMAPLDKHVAETRQVRPVIRMRRILTNRCLSST